MPPFVHSLNITDVNQIVVHFQNVPDMTEYILESDRYPLDALNEAIETLYVAKSTTASGTPEFKKYTRTITKIESVISTRIDYVKSIIQNLLGNDAFESAELSLDDSPTQEILFHIDLLKDVAHSTQINPEEYKEALRKLVKILKFRFDKGLQIHKRLHDLESEAIAEKQEEFPQTFLEEQKGFLQDALTMSRIHVPVTPAQIHQLKETLLKILESMGVRILNVERFQSRSEYSKILKEIEDVVIGAEIDFGQKFIRRFSDLLPEYIASHWKFYVIKHNRKLAELLLDMIDDPALLEDMYQVFIQLSTAEAIQSRQEAALAKAAFKPVQGVRYIKDAEKSQVLEIDRIKRLDINEKARELIKLSVYGLCEYLSKLSVEEFRKYPIGIVRSAQKALKDLEQHRLKKSDIQYIRNSPEYNRALETIEAALLTYASADEKYSFTDIYQETDCTIDGVTFCMFNDVILRTIQNITEAYFVVDSTEQDMDETRLNDLQITIVERYRAEWNRQHELEQQIEQKTMEALAAELA